MSQPEPPSTGSYHTTGEGDSSDSSVEIIVDGKRPTKRSTPRLVLEPSSRHRLSKKAYEANYEYQLKFLLRETSSNSSNVIQAQDEEIKACPLFSGEVLKHVNDTGSSVLPQYNLLAGSLELETRTVQDLIEMDMPDIGEQSAETQPAKDRSAPTIDPRIFLNVNAPWSAFICGSQGSGKSHTLSCMLENSLIQSRLGELPRPLAAIVFHYDRYSSYTRSQVCEAAYLCSTGVPVRVLVSPTNYRMMQETYSDLPGLGAYVVKPEVVALKFQESHLNVERILSLMSVSGKEGPTPLYIEVILRVLRQMAVESQGSPGLNYAAFRDHLRKEGFSRDQNTPLRMRLELLDSFMEPLQKGTKYPTPQRPVFEDNAAGQKAKLAWEKQAKKSKREWEQQAAESRRKENEKSSKAWTFRPGSLTIVDLSCPFVDDSAACSLFSICLAMFLENRENVGRIVALDEAHKFLKGTDAAASFSNDLLQVIREQRHLATRVIIATQEPTLSSKLLDLSSMTIVHRFTSPEWMQCLQAHLAAISNANGDGKRDYHDIFKSIVSLEAGQAVVFSPTAIMRISERHQANGWIMKEPVKLGLQYLKMQVRKRLTFDGGRSVMAV